MLAHINNITVAYDVGVHCYCFVDVTVSLQINSECCLYPCGLVWVLLTIEVLYASFNKERNSI